MQRAGALDHEQILIRTSGRTLVPNAIAGSTGPWGGAMREHRRCGTRDARRACICDLRM